jgi:hypothetical protein
MLMLLAGLSGAEKYVYPPSILAVRDDCVVFIVEEPCHARAHVGRPRLMCLLSQSLEQTRKAQPSACCCSCLCPRSYHV